MDYDASYIMPWAVRFTRRIASPAHLVRDYERAFARAVIERNELGRCCD